MTTKIKICGLTRKEDIQIANRYKPDFIGFVFADGRRKLSFSTAESLRGELSKEIKVVGVFVNEPLDNFKDIVKNNLVDLIQLHGDETASYLLKLKEITNKSIIKVIRAKSGDYIKSQLLSECGYFLLDSYKKGLYGGSGIAFDYSMLPKINKPFFIAGGLNRDNILDCILRTKPYGVDISSGVETNGVKDEGKVAEIIQMIRDIK